MSHKPSEPPIAVVGMGCRFPGGSSTASKLWNLLQHPCDVSKEIPPDRFNINRFYHKDGTHHGTTNVRRSYFLDENIGEFDTHFFAIPPNEAEAIDPQQRLLLEVVYEALEDSGLTLDGLGGSDTAVYVGLMCQDYLSIQAQDINSLPTYAATGVSSANASSRVSYFFDWHGPSMTIDTACSSSLVGVHEAVQALRNGTSRVTAACGTNLIIAPLSYAMESNLGMLSPDGQSRMWDADANGYARGEGVACLMLKTLSSAIQDGDDIKCVIREIGVNHDGRTTGLTMPSATAQASLIRATYAKAGLDPTTQSGRCQFFEAHGTGTPAGDPQEAEAISKAFFPADKSGDETLLVGSVKTVIGHTEGTAGIAGLIKACLALKHSTIPANLLFSRLNPALEPFTKHLRVPLANEPWPELPDGVPRRASVNSFGFGGTNAHAILESYTPSSPGRAVETNGTYSSAADCMVPMVFSAASDKSLLALLKSTLAFLDTKPNVDMPALAYTLGTKRSALSHRVSVSAGSVKTLREKIKAKIEAAAADDPPFLGIPALSTAPAILGVFTGQGAQWATMGAKIIACIPMARRIMSNLDESLATLPKCHRPIWKLMDELSADSQSRVREAVLSQPLCTAVQIILVDLLRAAGVRFRAVVGHSSGEIAAAYATGYLSSHDAIRIAYFRGYFAKLSAGPSGERGGMMAIGASFDHARELCRGANFAGRLSVAAYNSPTSVTLSGDLDALEQARTVFKEQNVFTRTLRVDTAYHSVHMLQCMSPYLRALQECSIQPLRREDDAPPWFSSVLQGRPIGHQDFQHLAGQYWVDNMVQPVLFCPAIEACVGSMAIDCALEIGPHPALQGPATECIIAVTGQDIPYLGTLKRHKNDVEAFSDALGYIWAHFDRAAIDLGHFHKICHPGQEQPTVIHDLPTYPWNHDRSLWAESRISKRSRTQPGRFHDLLGTQTADGPVEEWHWRNVLKTSELKWLDGHSLQGQTVFPATGYIALAMEAAMQIAGDRPVETIDLFDLEIRKPIAINDSTGTEILISMTKVSSLSCDVEFITADFAAYSIASKGSGHLALNCSGHVRIAIGTGDVSNRFPVRSPPPTSMSEVNVDRFYQVLSDDLGYGYEGPFRGLTRISRKSGFSTATIRCHPLGEDETTLLFHPGMLDSALHGLIAAYSAPGDGRIDSIVAPTSCRRVTLIPALCGDVTTDQVDIDCTITDGPRNSFMTGDVEVYSTNYAKRIIEIEGMGFSPFAAATAEDDRLVFQEAFLAVDKPDANAVVGDWRASPQEQRKALDAERAAFFYLKSLHLAVAPEEREKLPWYRQALINTAEKIYHRVNDGEHPHAPRTWINDTREMIWEMMESYIDDADFNLTKAVGEHLLIPSVLKGETSILQCMVEDNKLDRYYTNAIGFGPLYGLVAGVTEQLCTKFPRMNFLEVGAGTGGATQAILGKIGHAYSSYTYTDISAGFFDRAAGEKFQAHAHKMIFKTLDIEKDPTSQGFEPHSYDLVVASIVLHATKCLRETLENVRSLLRPGGYLVLVEVIRTDVMRQGLAMGGLPGWFIGEQDGRHGGPSISIEQWDGLLAETGFAGIETRSPMPDPVVVPGAVIVAQAQDEQFGLLSAPLGSSYPERQEQGRDVLVILGGGKKSGISELGTQLGSMLRPYFQQIVYLDHLDDVSDDDESGWSSGAHLLSLTELEVNMFEEVNKSRWQKLKRVLGSASSVLWLLKGSQGANPQAATTIGLFRTLFHELPGALLQTLDVGDDVKELSNNMVMVAELVVHLRTAVMMTRTGKLDIFLWSFEPELVLQDAQLYITRVRPHAAQNQRYNSAKRSITHLVDVSSTPLSLCRGGDQSYVLRRKHESLVPGKLSVLTNGSYDSKYVTIRISSSFLRSLKTLAGYVFVSLGTDTKTGAKILSFSDCNSSIITVPKSWTVCLEGGEEDESATIVDAQYMSLVVADLMAQQIVDMLPLSTGTVLAYEPDPVVASLLSKKLADRGSSGKALFITTSPPQGRLRRNWVYLHPHSAKRVIEATIPADDVILYVDASEDAGGWGGTISQSLGSRIPASLSPICEKMTLSNLMAQEASKLPEIAPESITRLLRKVASFASSMLNAVPDGAPLTMLTLEQTTSPTSPPSPNSLVDWMPDNPVPVSVERVLARADLFRPDRSYWLAGLSGDLGRSLAEFMASYGARHIVLSSRAPKIDQDWVQSHRAKGVAISYFACDLTNYDSVKQTYSKITETMPIVGGVANGAMVLRDGTFLALSFEDFQEGLRSKVNSSTNLDRVFSEEQEANEPLDWFVSFSSIVGMTGNPGQAAYTAGNCFMKGLTHQRRRRGVAASVIDISRVTGLGFIQRESSGRLTREHQERLSSRSGALVISDVDLHQLFAEAIVAGRPEEGLNPELISGLAPITTEQAKEVFWAPNARFSLLIREADRGAAAIGDKSARVSVRKLLEAATSLLGLRKILLGAFKAKLRSAMFLSDSDGLSETTPLVDTGVDSLVSVEIRAWFLKELGVDVPVMKILGGASIAELVDGVLDHLPRELLDRLQRSDAAAA